MHKKGRLFKCICFSIGFCLLALLVAIGCQADPTTQPIATTADGPQYGGTLVYADLYDLTANFGYPPEIIRNGTFRIMSAAIETLFHVDEKGMIVPWLAVGYEADPSDKSLTLTLREGVKFHDGSNFNAESVKWNLEQHMAAKLSAVALVESVDVIDTHTVRFGFYEWDNTFISSLTQHTGMMVSPTAAEKNGLEWVKNNPIGTGPFEFVSHEHDRVVFKRFDDYWQEGKPYLDGIEYIHIGDGLTRILSFRNAEIDLALSVDSKDVADLEKEGYVVIKRNVGSGATGIIPDSANPDSPWADVRVRQAAQHAINNESIVQSVLHGQAEPANQFIYEKHWAYNPNIKGYPYNPEKAKQLLADAGYADGFETILYYRANPVDDEVYTAVQGFLEEVGIRAKLHPVEFGLYDEMAWGGRGWEGLLQNAVHPNPDFTAAVNELYSGKFEDYYPQMLVPDDYVEAIQNAISAADDEDKQKNTWEASKLMIDKYALQILLYCFYDIAVNQDYVHNHGYFGTPHTAQWTPEEVWIEK